MSQADAVAEVRHNPAQSDPALAFTERALEEIHSSLMTFGCWPAPQPRKPVRALVDLDSFLDGYYEPAEYALEFANLLCYENARQRIRREIEEPLRDWLRGRAVVQQLAADMAREEEDCE